MKIEIELSEEDAALLWWNQWGERTPGVTVEECVKSIAEESAARLLRAFPNEAAAALEAFRASKNQTPMTRCPDCGKPVPTIFEHVDGCPDEKEVEQ